MARIRTVKPDFFRHADLYEVEMETGLPLRIAFAGLWTASDREGRFVWKPRELKLDALPYDDLDFSRVLDALRSRGFIMRYEVNGKAYGCIPSWCRHQVINNRESESVLPAPPGVITTIVQDRKNNPDQADDPACDPACNRRVDDASSTPLMHAQAEGEEEGKRKEEKEKNVAPDGACPSCPTFSPLARLLEAGVEKQVAQDWLAVRKAKRLAPTETAIDEVLRAIGEAGMSAQDGIRLCCVRGWAGFNAKWIGPEAEQAQASRSRGAWWATDESILARGVELGMHPLAGESMATFKGRIQAAIDNEGKPVKRTTSAAHITHLPVMPKGAKPEGLNLKALVRSASGGNA